MTEDDNRGTGGVPGPPEQMQVRLAKIDRMRSAGIDPYPVGYPRTHMIAEVRNEFGELPPDIATGKRVGVTGRVLLYRNGGKLCFAMIRDGSGEIQVMISLDRAGEEVLAAWKQNVDLGDHIGVTGEVISSRSGELSVLSLDLVNVHVPKLVGYSLARLEYVLVRSKERIISVLEMDVNASKIHPLPQHLFNLFAKLE